MTDSDQLAEPAECTRLPLVGDRVPDFEAESTHGPVRLTDHYGQWLVLFSRPPPKLPPGVSLQ